VGAVQLERGVPDRGHPVAAHLWERATQRDGTRTPEHGGTDPGMLRHELLQQRRPGRVAQCRNGAGEDRHLLVVETDLDDRVATGNPGEDQGIALAGPLPMEEGAGGIAVQEVPYLLGGDAQVDGWDPGLVEQSGTVETRSIHEHVRLDPAVAGLEAGAIEPVYRHPGAEIRTGVLGQALQALHEVAHVHRERPPQGHPSRTPSGHQVDPLPSVA